MIILHGDDTVKSRRNLNDLINAARYKEQEIKHYDADSLDLTLLTQVLEGLTLFGKTPLLIIEGLFSLPKSKKKDNLIEFIGKYTDRDLIIYEGKSLSVTALKLFAKAQVYEHKPAAIIFTFLENLQPGSGSKSLGHLSDLEQAGEPAELVFAMLVRQVRLLIQALESSSLKVAPWQKTRLISQARAFGERGLLKFHGDLYYIDKQLKTGKNTLGLSIQLFNLVASL